MLGFRFEILLHGYQLFWFRFEILLHRYQLFLFSIGHTSFWPKFLFTLHILCTLCAAIFFFVHRKHSFPLLSVHIKHKKSFKNGKFMLMVLFTWEFALHLSSGLFFFFFLGSNMELISHSIYLFFPWLVILGRMQLIFAASTSPDRGNFSRVTFWNWLGTRYKDFLLVKKNVKFQ